jgi:transcriptional regulator with XRE-family HTH domain
MPRWRALPEELDPQVREFASQLRRLVDRSGLSVAAVADRTGYSKTSWERYLNGRLLAPKGAVVALAEVTGTSSVHLTTMWELAERAWSRSEMRHDMTMEAIRISQARAALGEFGPAPVNAKNGKARPGTVSPPPGGPDAGYAAAIGRPGAGVDNSRASVPEGLGVVGGRTSMPAPPGPPRPPASPNRQRGGGRFTMFLAGVVGALLVIAAAVLLTDIRAGGDDAKDNEAGTPAATATSSASDPKLPAGVKCSGADCAGQDPENMGCGGELAKTVGTATVGTATVEVRYSETCSAAWARITQAAVGDEVTITAKGGEEQGTVDGDADAYTPMVAVTDPAQAKACATITSGENGCT